MNKKQQEEVLSEWEFVDESYFSREVPNADLKVLILPYPDRTNYQIISLLGQIKMYDEESRLEITDPEKIFKKGDEVYRKAEKLAAKF